MQHHGFAGLAPCARETKTLTSLALGLLMSLGVTGAMAQDIDLSESFELDDLVLSSYEEEILQSLGVSVITAEALNKTPVANDISEIVRKMPGVNLSGNTPSGDRGNQRQIDLRGMGPENVLILIDGKPVLSRNSVRMGRSGERDTRGDGNWVPAEMIEKIEVIRGPAAARYGSGAAGGVVNIITKRPDTDLFEISLRATMPQSDLEGGDQRINGLWVKPMNDKLTLRLSGSYNKSDGDDPDINDEADCDTGVDCTSAAGVEGVINNDVTAALRWEVDAANTLDFELTSSNQRNIYAGDSLRSPGRSTDAINELADTGANTNEMRRLTASMTHTGAYAWGDMDSYVQYERTDNTRLNEGNAGGVEGVISTTSPSEQTAILDVLSAKSEADIDTKLFGKDTVLTLGAELRHERLDFSDYNEDTITYTDTDNVLGGLPEDASARKGTAQQTLLGAYAEANILANDWLTLSPALRVDTADTFGLNISGGFNASADLGSGWTAKAGLSSAFKSPSLYQLSESYLWYTAGNGCPIGEDGTQIAGPCFVLGNPDLDPETSINKEVGVSYDNGLGLNASLTYFHNDYRDKIQAGLNEVGTLSSCSYPRGSRTVTATDCSVFRWENIPEAEVSGLEASFATVLSDSLSMNVNASRMISSTQRLTLNTGEVVNVPLSLVPEYTVNAGFEWEALPGLTLLPSATYYSAIEPSAYSTSTGTAASGDDLTSQEAYTLVNLAMAYEVNDAVTLTGGIKNLFDTSVKRTGDGAESFNESGREFYVGLTASF